MKYFTAAPACGGFTAGQWYLVGGESQVVGPICKLGGRGEGGGERGEGGGGKGERGRNKG